MMRIIYSFCLLFSVGYLACQPSAQANEGHQPENITYSINLLCISDQLRSGDNYICPEKYFEPLITSARKWAQANPGIDINIWYDPNTASYEAVSRSEGLLVERVTGMGVGQVHLRSIYDIPVVIQNKAIFSEKFPLYFRIDLLKLVIVTHEIADRKLQSAIFTDVEVGDLRRNQDRMDFSELFEAKVVNALKVYGLLLNTKGREVENQFIQVWRNPVVIASLKLWINVNLARAVFLYNCPRIWHMEASMLYESPFYTTIRDFDPYLMAAQYGRVEINTKYVLGTEKVEWVPYDPAKHGIAPFGIFWNQRAHRGAIVDNCALDNYVEAEPWKYGKPEPWGVLSYQVDRASLPSGLISGREVDVRGANHHVDKIQTRDPRDTTDISFVPWN